MNRSRQAGAEQWKRTPVSRVVITLPMPPSVNRLWTVKPGGMYRSRRYETWARAAGNEINRQKPGSVRGHYELTLTVEDKPRRPDLGNTEKAVSDLLQEHGVIENDALCQKITLEWSREVKGARVAVQQWIDPALGAVRLEAVT